MSEELEELLEDYFFKTAKELSSYSDALESRVRDRFMDYFVEIKEVGSSEENAQILHNARIIVQKKQRRALDFVDVETVEVDIEEPHTETTEPRPNHADLLDKIDKGEMSVDEVIASLNKGGGNE